MKIYINEHDFVEVGDVSQKPVVQEIVTRSGSYSVQALQGALPNPDPVLKKSGNDISVYNTLLFDAHVGAEVDKLIDGVNELEWDVDRGRTKSRYARMIKDWMEDFNWTSFIEGVVNARLFGFQPMEVNWSLVGDMYLPFECVPKPQEWFRYDSDNILLFRSKDNQEGERLDAYAKKFIVPKYRATYVNPYGTGVLSRCFWPVAFKNGGLKLWLTFIEKYGMPWITIHVPPSTTNEERQALLAMGTSMIHDAVAVVNDTDKLVVTEAAGKTSSSDLYHAMVRFQNEEISKAITSQTLTSQLGENGSYGAAKTHGDVLDTAVKSTAKLVIRSINELVRWIIEANYGDVPAPRIILYEEDDVDKNLAERDKLLTDAGVKLTRSYYIRSYGFDEKDIQEEDAPMAIVPPAAAAPPSPPVANDPATPPEPGVPADPASPPQFAEGQSSPDPDQAAVDGLDAAVSDEDLQRQMEKVVGPALELVRSCKNYAELAERLSSIWPEMDTSEIEDTLGRMMFLSNIAGRANAAN